MQFNLWVKQYLRYLKLEKGLSIHSVDAYEQDVLKLKYYIEEQTTIRNLNLLQRETIEGFMLWLNDLGLSANSQARTISGAKSFFSFLVLENIMSTDVNQWMVTPKTTRRIPEILSRQEIEEMLEGALSLTKEHLVNIRNHAIIELMYATGIRVSELISLQKKQMNFTKGYIRVLGKGNKERIVPFHNKAKQSIKLYWEELSLGSKKWENNEYVFLNRRGKSLTRNMVFILLKNIATKVGITKKVSPHLLRHSFASHMIQAGADIRVVQVLLGHKSILTTEIYTHFDVHHLRETLERCHPIYMK